MESRKGVIFMSRTRKKYSTSNVFFMISGKRNLSSPSCSTFPTDIGSRWDIFEEHLWKYRDDALYQKTLVEQKRLFKFLIGLNKNLDDVRGRILSKRPIPSLQEAFTEVRREHSHKKVMLGKQDPSSNFEASPFISLERQSSTNNRKQQERVKCDHYHKLGHMKDT